MQPLGTRKLYWRNSDTTADSVPNHDAKDSDAGADADADADAASAMMASAFTAAAVTLLTF